MIRYGMYIINIVWLVSFSTCNIIFLWDFKWINNLICHCKSAISYSSLSSSFYFFESIILDYMSENNISMLSITLNVKIYSMKMVWHKHQNSDITWTSWENREKIKEF